MANSAFPEKLGGYTVDCDLYKRHQSRPYIKPEPGTPRRPEVSLQMQTAWTSVPERIPMLVDTGSDISTLNGDAADELGVDRRRDGDEELVVCPL